MNMHVLVHVHVQNYTRYIKNLNVAKNLVYTKPGKRRARVATTWCMYSYRYMYVTCSCRRWNTRHFRQVAKIYVTSHHVTWRQRDIWSCAAYRCGCGGARAAWRWGRAPAAVAGGKARWRADCVCHRCDWRSNQTCSCSRLQTVYHREWLTTALSTQLSQRSWHTCAFALLDMWREAGSHHNMNDVCPNYTPRF